MVGTKPDSVELEVLHCFVCELRQDFISLGDESVQSEPWHVVNQLLELLQLIELKGGIRRLKRKKLAVPSMLWLCILTLLHSAVLAAIDMSQVIQYQGSVNVQLSQMAESRTIITMATKHQECCQLYIL